MRRCSIARAGREWAASISVLSVLVFGSGSCAAATPAASSANPPSSDVIAVSTLDLTGLQNQFGNVADHVSPAVVAISASCTTVDTDEALRTENLNPQKLDSMLSKTTRTVGTGFFVDSDV